MSEPNSLISRRSLVFGGASLAGLTATGCCTALPVQRITAACSNRPTPFLAGAEVKKAWSGAPRYFDAHTHFFNAQDVPVAGFLKKSVAHSIDSDLKRKLIIALAPVAEALAHLAPAPEVEYRDLCNSSDKAFLGPGGQSDALDKEIESRRDAVARELYQRIVKEGDEIPQLFNEAAARVKSQDKSEFLTQPFSFNEELVRDALRNGGRQSTDGAALVQPSLIGQSAAAADALSLKGALQFLGFMLSPRHHNLRTYIRRYAQSSPGLPLSGCFAAMVDFNYWLDCAAKASNMFDQVQLHAQLSTLSRGFFLPLVSYNPWVDIKENNASLDLVEKAVKYHGCVGVKIYPPMGFYPYGNDGNPISSTEPRPDLKELDNRLLQFYELCDGLGVPVMAHANESNGRDNAHDILAGPAGWFKLRDEVPSLKALRINAGHFGGDEVHSKGDWSEEFVRLMSEPGHLKAYADLGYWAKLVKHKDSQDKLARLIKTPLWDGGTVADRVMHGSDWLMLSNEPGWEAYGDSVAKVVRDLDPSGQVAQKVLGANVLECYGLTADSNRGEFGGGTFKRLQDFHAKNGSGIGWVKTG